MRHFDLAGSRDKSLAALRRCFAHLQDGGALLFNVKAEYAWPEWWEKWEPAQRKTLPEPWPEEGKRRVAADGSEYVERFRLVSIDPLEQTDVRQVRIEKWVSGKLVGSQEDMMHGTLYLPQEVLLMLQVTGFSQIIIRGDYSDERATPDTKELIFTAQKASSS